MQYSKAILQTLFVEMIEIMQCTTCRKNGDKHILKEVAKLGSSLEESPEKGYVGCSLTVLDSFDLLSLANSFDLTSGRSSLDPSIPRGWMLTEALEEVSGSF